MVALHTYMEFASFGLCILIAGFMVFRWGQIRTRFHFWWTLGFALAGLCDFMHAYSSFLKIELVWYWVPFTWAVSRTVLGVCLLIGVLSASKAMSPRIGPWIICGAAMLTLFLLHPNLARHMEWVYSSIDCDVDGIWNHIVGLHLHNHRLLDNLIALLFVAVGVCLYRNEDARIQSPIMTWTFLGLGVLVHAVMGLFSKQSLDGPFMLAHWLKLIEECFWVVRCMSDTDIIEKITATNPSLDRLGEILRGRKNV